MERNFWVSSGLRPRSIYQWLPGNPEGGGAGNKEWLQESTCGGRVRQAAGHCRKPLWLTEAIPPRLLCPQLQASTRGPLQTLNIYSKKPGHWSGAETLETCLQRLSVSSFLQGDCRVCVQHPPPTEWSSAAGKTRHTKGHSWLLKSLFEIAMRFYIFTKALFLICVYVWCRCSWRS